MIKEPVRIVLTLIQSPSFPRELDVYLRVPNGLCWLGLIAPQNITYTTIDELFRATYSGKSDVLDYSYTLQRYNAMPNIETLFGPFEPNAELA